MSNPMIRIHYTETNEVIDREMTDAEYADYLLFIEQSEADKKAQENLAIAKADAEAKLAALGLTSDDLKALGLG